jgi:predicted RNA-binding protein with PIN domain
MLIVDGRGVPSPFRPWHTPPCGAHRRLVVDIARLTRDWECCVDVVFPGHPSGGLGQRQLVSSVRVWFSEWRSVDRYVVAGSQGQTPGRLFVVTSDRELARRVRSLGAQIVSGEALRRALDMVCAEANGGARRPSPLTQEPQALLALDVSLR